MLKQAVATLEKNDPNRLIYSKQTVEEKRAKYFANDRDMIGLLLIVSGLLLLVTALGIIGLASFWVQQRAKQIGIRRALGATRAQILRYFQTENFLLAGIGIVVGMLLAYLLNQWLMGRYELPRLPLLPSAGWRGAAVAAGPDRGVRPGPQGGIDSTGGGHRST